MSTRRVLVAAALAALTLTGTAALGHSPTPVQSTAVLPAAHPGTAPAPDAETEEPEAEAPVADPDAPADETGRDETEDEAGRDEEPATVGTPDPTDTPAPPSADAPPPSEEDADAGGGGGWFGGEEELDGLRRPYPGSPAEEAGLVADEEHRLNEVRMISSVNGFNDQLRRPYRLVTGASYTLVLTARREVYTVTDLLDLAPQTFVRQADGTFLLTEHVVVQQGAILELNLPGRLELRLASDADGFASIVSWGGRLEITGTEGSPVLVTSWNRQTNSPDTDTTDGRAYIRAIGGQVGMSNVRAQQLGFWSGRTGGLAMTGTDRPSPGALDALGESITDPDDLNGPAPDTTSLDGALPTGDLPLGEFDIDAPQYSYVSVNLTNVEATGNAFGLFIAGANGIDIRGGSFADSLVDGVTLHRFVSNVVIDGTRSAGNGGDGFVMARATTGTILSAVLAEDNARNGVTMSGLPLASGPSAAGTAIGDYGSNAVTNSRMDGNGRYGIEVIGGHDLNINANDLVGNDMGIVVRGGARTVSVVGNNITDPQRQGIALRDGVVDTTVSGNITTGGETSVYVRASAVDITRNTLSDATVHGITLVDDVGGTVLEENTISGRGPSAIDFARAVNADTRDFDNSTAGWTDTTPWIVTLKRILQPLNLLWTILGLTVVITAITGLRHRGKRAHPYDDKRAVAGEDDVVDYAELSDRPKVGV